ncbi:MAG: hypothetical protein MJ229_08030 [bacterium]|nr:hypothetical protein [bacterium]
MFNKNQEKKEVSRLIYLVLAESLLVREAIKSIPVDSSDESIKAAYHALVHREADEDLRKRDIEYRKEQDEYLEFIANTLQAGRELPKNIIRNYKKYYPENNLTLSKGVRLMIEKLCKFLNV